MVSTFGIIPLFREWCFSIILLLMIMNLVSESAIIEKLEYTTMDTEVIFSTSTKLKGKWLKEKAHKGSDALSIRAISFNTWLTGRSVNNGLEKVVKHIKYLNPDIAALQEVHPFDIVKNITSLLGKPWIAISKNASNPDTIILTQHEEEVVDIYYGFGAQVLVTKQGHTFPVNFFSMHLNYVSYGPYAAQNKMVNAKELIMKGEDSKDGNGRAANIRELLVNPKFQEWSKAAESAGPPVIIAGDFNCPSHIDWIEETKSLHGGWTFEWPATKLLTDIGMIDSFREIHSDVMETPGHTWSTVQNATGWEWDYSIPEPQDRIDFIFYKGSKSLKPKKSYTYSGDPKQKPQPIPNHANNDYPSDHYTVVTDFDVLL
ncbi:endonuclease/Exonuclease/phosphatase family domain-containing protein [Ditylenchus destructor]|uniref:Endonuclease/Exonuclease/phosphatase family domain-containing protein n=1 Tax=Ditylenchus destructor TaxID=166010 RepID=A0AAD4MPY5_9BILA|nr:endonuclease/Exonuclease/phosphatase family domain-containing protein [Ditylenchus destructor]